MCERYVKTDPILYESTRPFAAHSWSIGRHPASGKPVTWGILRGLPGRGRDTNQLITKLYDDGVPWTAVAKW
jgi:hypothetical protein